MMKKVCKLFRNRPRMEKLVKIKEMLDKNIESDNEYLAECRRNRSKAVSMVSHIENMAKTKDIRLQDENQRDFYRRAHAKSSKTLNELNKEIQERDSAIILKKKKYAIVCDRLRYLTVIEENKELTAFTSNVEITNDDFEAMDRDNENMQDAMDNNAEFQEKQDQFFEESVTQPNERRTDTYALSFDTLYETVADDMPYPVHVKSAPVFVEDADELINEMMNGTNDVGVDNILKTEIELESIAKSPNSISTAAKVTNRFANVMHRFKNNPYSHVAEEEPQTNNHYILST